MLTADDVQKWLEEKRTLPGSAQLGGAPEPARDRARAAASVAPLGAPPGGRGGNVLVLRDPVRAPGAQGVLAAMGSTELDPAERPRRSWPLTLGVGLLSGVVLGAGLVGLAGSAPPWIAGLLGAESPVASAVPQEPTPTTATEPGPAEPSEPAILEPAALDPAPRDAAPAPTQAPVEPAPIQPGPASPAASDAAPPAPRLVDPPRSDPRPVLVQADRRPLRRRPAVLEPPGVDDGSAVLTATAPLDAAPWRPSSLPEPEVDAGAPAPLAASASPEVARIGLVQALAAPSGPDRPPAPDVAGTAVATAPLPAAAPLRVALHLAPSLPQTAIYDAQAAVTEAGLDLAGTSLARFGVARSEVRFFHGADAAGAAQIADSLGAQARDFSAYRPAPPPGTVEVWLAPEG